MVQDPSSEHNTNHEVHHPPPPTSHRCLNPKEEGLQSSTQVTQLYTHDFGLNEQPV